MISSLLFSAAAFEMFLLYGIVHWQVMFRANPGAISHGDLIRSRHLALRRFPPFKELCVHQLRRIEAHISEEKVRLFG